MLCKNAFVKAKEFEQSARCCIHLLRSRSSVPFLKKSLETKATVDAPQRMFFAFSSRNSTENDQHNSEGCWRFTLSLSLPPSPCVPLSFRLLLVQVVWCVVWWVVGWWLVGGCVCGGWWVVVCVVWWVVVCVVWVVGGCVRVVCGVWLWKESHKLIRLHVYVRGCSHRRR